MNYYSPESIHTISDTNAVDERWDGNLGYYSSDQSFKDHQLESRFQNINITKEISPPLTSTKIGIKELSSGFFKEDIEQDSYFHSFNSPVIVNTTPPDECDYLTTQDSVHDNPKPYRRNPEDEHDLSIVSLNELPSTEALQFQNQDEQVYGAPISRNAYHSGLMKLYSDNLLRLVDQQGETNSLPKVYKIYISNVRISCYTQLPNSV